MIVPAVDPRLERLAKARAAAGPRKPRVAASVKDDFLAMDEWERIAAEFGVRLPQRGQAVTISRIRKWLKKIGVPVEGYLVWTASKNLKHAMELVGNWGLRSYCGAILEERERLLRYASESGKLEQVKG